MPARYQPIQKNDLFNMLHRNSQKRFYIKDGTYFITTNAIDGLSFFEEDLFCDVFVEDLWYAQSLKRFIIFAFKVNPEHAHLLIKPNEKHNYSEIMGSFKRNVSRDINTLMNGENFVRKTKGDDSNCRLWENDPHFIRHIRKLKSIQRQFFDKYVHDHPFSKFNWQKSFNHHYIENKRDFINHVNYIKKQYIKHDLGVNKYCFINEEAINKILTA